MMTDSLDLAKKIAEIMDERKAADIKVLKIEDITVISDYFVICTGLSTTHIKALSDEIDFRLKKQEINPHHIEGHMSGGWILMDYPGVVAHLFLKDVREFYSLERLWGDASPVAIAGIGANEGAEGQNEV